MDTPARAAERILLGLGVALLIATGFALIDGRLPPADCPDPATISALAEPCTASGPIGWLVPACAALTLGIGLMQRFSRTSGSGSLLGGLFPEEREDAVAGRMAQEDAEANDEDRLSEGWARLEEKMLSDAVDEEE